MKKLVELLISLATLGMLLWGFYNILNLIFTSLPPWAASVTTTGIIGILSLAIGNYLTARREVELKLREDKVKVYSKFIQEWLKIIIANKNSNYVESEEFKDFLIDFTGELILWGSDKVVKNYSEFRQNSSQYQENPKDLLLKFESLMYDMRKDLGHSNNDLKKSDLLALFITDIQNLHKITNSGNDHIKNFG